MNGQRPIWITLVVISGVMVGAGAGLLTHAAGAGVATSILTAGGTFAGTVLLFLAVLSFLGGSGRDDHDRHSEHHVHGRDTWITLVVISGVIVGASAGLLTHAAGAGVATSILTAGGAFAGAVLLFLAVLSFLGGSSGRDDATASS
jgi:hypothetical protein